MRQIKIAACSLMLLAAASAPALAQQGGGGGMGGRMNPAQMAQRTSDRFMTGITLTAAETDSVKAINERYSTGLQAAMGGTDMREKMTELRKTQQTALRGILTADQQKVFDKNVEEMEKARMNRQPRPQSN
ncbi:MAG: hypothetical protein ABI026_10935 [Gemmatimonadaceae bacterium]